MGDPFTDALAFTLRWEGSFSDHPSDRGGPTYCGISRRAHPQWEGWRVVDAHQASGTALHLDAFLEAAVRRFYRAYYWEPILGDALPRSVALAVFDWAVHSGVDRATRELQCLTGAREDGDLGPKTVDAVLRYADRCAASQFIECRRRFVTELVTRNPTQEVFAVGWNNRLDELEQAIT